MQIHPQGGQFIGGTFQNVSLKLPEIEAKGDIRDSKVKTPTSEEMQEEYNESYAHEANSKDTW